MLGDPGMDLLDLPDLVDRRKEDLFLAVIAGPEPPFVMEIEEVARFFKSDREGVREEIEGELRFDAVIQEVVDPPEDFLHRLFVNLSYIVVFPDQKRQDIVRLSRIVRVEDRAGGGGHTVALVLAVSGV